MTGPGGDRAQINFDFAVGVSVVIVTVILAFSLVPGLFGGVTEAREQSDEVVADRIGENLVEGAMAVPNDPGAIDSGCLRALFYNDGPNRLNYCGFDEGSIQENVGVEDRFVNVRVLGDVDGDGTVNVLYWNGGGLQESGSSSARLGGGDNPESVSQLGVAKRAVTIDGTPARIIVRVW